MSEKKSLFSINIVFNIIAVYFDTFFVLYFFNIANYEVLPLGKYYLTQYFICGLTFYLIRNFMKQNVKVPFFRIGISLEAIYIALIMLLKKNIINYIYLVGIVKGIAEAFYYYPKNIIETEKITNEERQKYSGRVNTICKISAIIVPLILGLALTYISYVNLGKIFFVLFIVLFIISFYLKDLKYNNQKMNLKKFLDVIKTNKELKKSFLIIFLAGLSYSSGFMGTIITLANINVFKTNLNLGFVDSICAGLFLLTCILFSHKIKEKHFGILSIISGIITFICLFLFSINQNITLLILILLTRNSLVGLLNLISNHLINNMSNSKEIKENYKAEYFLIRDLIFSSTRCFGYLLILIVSMIFGKEYIYYILIISAISLLIEGFIINKLVKK